MKIITIDEIKQRIENVYLNEPYEIIEYTAVTKPFTIKCLRCNEIKTYSSFKNFVSSGSKQTRNHICICYNANNKNVLHKANEEKIKWLCKENKDIELINFDYRENTKKYSVNVKCLLCNQIFNKDISTFLKNQDCPYCKNRHNLNTKGFQASLPEEYTLLSEYTGTENKILIRHKCGFIWKIKPHTLIEKINNNYLGCPKCNHKRSKGENKIAIWLKNKQINFEEEKTFDWQSNSKFRYDFYIKDYNLIIEYMGLQHYKEVNFFHDTLEERKSHDVIKEQEAKQHNINYLIIPYTEYNNIDQILFNWFNDYPEREQAIND